jgi:hypothetical protein
MDRIVDLYTVLVSSDDVPSHCLRNKIGQKISSHGIQFRNYKSTNNIITEPSLILIRLTSAHYGILKLRYTKPINEHIYNMLCYILLFTNVFRLLSRSSSG